MARILVFVLAGGERFVAQVQAERAEEIDVRAPLLLSVTPGVGGDPVLEWTPLLALARRPVATVRRNQLLVTYEPNEELERRYCSIAGVALPPEPEPEAPKTCFPESALAHRYLDGLRGVEIGGSAHNPFGLHSINIDYTSSMDTVFKQEERRMCGRALPVDLVAAGDRLPLLDGSVDFVINSHVIEHLWDSIGTLKEWHRVLKPGGILFLIVPHRDRTFDRDRPRTSLLELIKRHRTGGSIRPDLTGHASVWITEDFVELIDYLGWELLTAQDVDDKVGNGFTIVVRKAA